MKKIKEEDGDNFIEAGNVMDSEEHGFIFEGMYKPDRIVNMKGRTFVGMVFSPTGEFAGYVTRDRITKEDEFIVPYEFKDRTKEMTFQSMNGDFVRNYDERHTRLLGFRSGKRCLESKTISTIQPIFYSISEKMCKEILKPL